MIDLLQFDHCRSSRSARGSPRVASFQSSTGRTSPCGPQIMLPGRKSRVSTVAARKLETARFTPTVRDLVPRARDLAP